MAIVRDIKRHRGTEGEYIAMCELITQGYTVIARNFRFEKAEIDLITISPPPDEQLVFVEVKTRKWVTGVFPEAAVTLTKQAHIFRAAQAFIAQRQFMDLPARFDVVAIRFKNPVDYELIHIQDAFQLTIYY